MPLTQYEMNTKEKKVCLISLKISCIVNIIGVEFGFDIVCL